MRLKLLTGSTLVAALALTCTAQDRLLVDIREVYPQELRFEGFRLDREQDVQIESVGLHHRDERKELMLGTAWILNATSRDVVWQFEPETMSKRRFQVQEQTQAVRLPAGSYEAYYAAFPNYLRHDSESHGKFSYYMGKLFDELFHRDYGYSDHDSNRDMFKEFRLVVNGNGKKVSKEEIRKQHQNLRDEAVIAMVAERDDFYERRGFEVNKQMQFQIYAIGEVRRDGDFDYGWIINEATGERVWQFTYRNSQPAGGASKNRMLNEVISLPEGRYVASFVTDDSHSPQEWNSAPPHDPSFWGMTIRAVNPQMKKYVKEFDYEGLLEKNIIISFSRVRENEFLSKGFTLKKRLNTRIYAMGEGRDGEMYDYGWLINADTGNKIWSMDFHDTDHAGGGQKNRLYDRVIQLDKGNYMAYYVSDGSHCYGDWNTSPPYDPERWGMTLVAVDSDFDRKDVTEYREQDDPNVLASLVRVRDNAYERATFKLAKDGEVRVYAIGEGSHGNMHDYGWIEDAQTGRVVWEMSYRMTENAGGASKNRMFNGSVFLKAGEYRVYFETDDSHSFQDWNSSPPDDQLNYGITIRLADKR